MTEPRDRHAAVMRSDGSFLPGRRSVQSPRPSRLHRFAHKMNKVLTGQGSSKRSLREHGRRECPAAALEPPRPHPFGDSLPRGRPPSASPMARPPRAPGAPAPPLRSPDLDAVPLSFAIEAVPAGPHHLNFRAFPEVVQPGTPFSVVVAIESCLHEAVPTATMPLTLSVAAGGAALQTATKPPQHGLVVFEGCVVHSPGRGALRAESVGTFLDPIEQAFVVEVPPPPLEMGGGGRWPAFVG